MVIEAHLDKQRGISAILMIKDGELKSGMYIVCGTSFAPTRVMENFLGNKIPVATCSSPVKISGFDKLPDVGEFFKSFENKKDAEKYLAEQIENNEKVAKKVNVEENPDEVTIRVMLKAEVSGSLSAMEHEIEKIKNEKVKIKIIGSGIGNISENDVKMASGKNPAIIIGFDVGIDSSAKGVAERYDVRIETFKIIYKIAEWLEEEVKLKTPKIITEEVIAVAKILKVFSTMKDKHIIGARVEKGEVMTGQEGKIKRGLEEIGRGKVRELQKDKSKIGEVHEGVEFGCQFQSETVPAPGDKIEIFKLTEK